MTEDLYEILNIDRTATKEEIKKAYRTKAKEHHPDKGGDEAIFKKVSYAYDVLSDETKKSRYDSMGHDGINGTRGDDMPPFDSSFFENMFGKQEAQHNKLRFSIRVKIDITVEEVYSGITKSFGYDRQIKCQSCNGKGGTNPKHCPNCHGSGKTTRVVVGPYSHMQEISNCVFCNGKGVKFDDTCTTCDGSGFGVERTSISINIPHGFISGNTIIRDNMGHAMPDGTYGDLIAIIEVIQSDSFQIVNNYDLISIIKVPYETFLLGGKVIFTTIDKTKINVSVPELSKVGDKLRVKSKGLMMINSKDRGNQILILDIDMPTVISSEEKELLLKLKKLRK